MAANVSKVGQRGTGQEQATPSQTGFPDVRRYIPQQIASRIDIPLVDNLSSYLGARNPLAKPVDPVKDVVWLLDNTAYRSVNRVTRKPQSWTAEFVAAYFEKGSGKDESKWIADIADKIGLGAEGEDRAAGEATIARRLQPLFDSIRPARSVQISLPNGDAMKLGPGGRNAISSQIVGIKGNHNDGDSMQVSAVPPHIAPHGPMLTHFADVEGWTIISDIDDTIKITMTASPVGILRSTFVSTPTPIAGMPDLYQHIVRTLNPTWFYLSASPYNLYFFLRPFLHQYYPKGTLVLRDASWMDLAGFIGSLTQGTEEYKSSRIDKIHTWLPHRKVLCVGDSTQSDPEAYGNMYRKHGRGWIKAIYIRKVTDVAGIEGKNADARFEEAFRDVPRDVWRVFEDPRELYEAVEGLKEVDTKRRWFGW